MPLSAHALSTVAQVKSFVIDKDTLPASSHDSLFEFLINATSEMIERYCNRHFEKKTYTLEKYIGHGRQYLKLKNYPINSVTTVTVGGSAVASSDYTILKEEGMLFKQTGWLGGILESDQLSLNEPHPYAVKFNIEVTYDAGYVLPNGTPRDLPFDLELACIRWTLAEYLLRDKQGITGISLEGLSVDINRMPDDIKSILDRYVEAA